jgi:hypothetical protein
MRGLPKPFPVDPQVLAEYAGRYQFSDGVIVTICVDGNHIFVQVPNDEEFELTTISENQFYLREYDAEITFYKNASGEVDRLVYTEPGEPMGAKKVP